MGTSTSAQWDGGVVFSISHIFFSQCFAFFSVIDLGSKLTQIQLFKVGAYFSMSVESRERCSRQTPWNLLDHTRQALKCSCALYLHSLFCLSRAWRKIVIQNPNLSKPVITAHIIVTCSLLLPLHRTRADMSNESTKMSNYYISPLVCSGPSG